MSPQDMEKPCAEIEPLLVFYVCEEVTDQERGEIDRHLAMCSACTRLLAEEREFQATFASLPRTEDTAGVLLSQCRSEFAEKLDDIHNPPVRAKVLTFSFLRRWMMLHPAWSGATLVLLGLVTGAEFSKWSGPANYDVALDPTVNVRPPSNPRFTEDQLSKMVVAGVNFAPSQNSDAHNVRVQLSAEQPVELTGTLDDSDVRDVLTYVVKNGERFDSGVRLDCLDALRARAADSEIRSALLCAARRDQNPAVRLKALEALRGAVSDDVVRSTLLQALQHDSNPGVRVEAVNLLVRSLESAPQDVLPPMPSAAPELPHPGMMQAGAGAPVDGSFGSVIRALEDLQHNDPSRYVRLRSAAALRQISARNDQ